MPSNAAGGASAPEGEITLLIIITTTMIVIIIIIIIIIVIMIRQTNIKLTLTIMSIHQ